MIDLVPAWIFVKGLAIGFLIAAPVGPINVLCVRRTLIHGHLAGIASGFGAAAADTVFGALAAFGVRVITEQFFAHQFALSILGGAFLLVLGVFTLMKPPPELTGGRDPTGLAADFTSTFLLTLTNPITIFSFIGTYVAFGVQPDARIDLGDWLLLLGVFLGSCTWWLLITTTAAFFRARFTTVGFKWANRIAGLVIVAFGLFVLWEAFVLGGPGQR
ncbi:MAG: LysE family translocator [Alphaproteobacteria bacterium]|nr:LysE family translocator [Alphaproteobacteria bacterium]